MQSSTAIAIRALVMLIVLISVPLFAIFGKNMPEVIKGLMEGRGLVLGPANGQNAASNLQAQAQSNPFMQPAPYRASPDSGRGADPAANASSVDLRSPRAITGPAAAQPASFQAASEAAPMGQDAVASLESKQPPLPGNANPVKNRIDSDQSRFGNAIDTSISQPERQPAAPSAAHPNELAAAPGALPAVGSSVGEEKFRRAEMRLRELGATQYVLEAWGHDNSRYLFVCRMAVGGNPNVNQVFQATKTDPWDAMQDVLAQVEQWRSQPPR
jgi:hypothetical protein